MNLHRDELSNRGSVLPPAVPHIWLDHLPFSFTGNGEEISPPGARMCVSVIIAKVNGLVMASVKH